MAESISMSRRERKKAALRQKISHTATTMFIERGFDNVTIKEIADEVDVSPTTVFSYFPQKEALVWDEDEEQQTRLVSVVRERRKGKTITQALHDYYAEELVKVPTEHGSEPFEKFMALVNATPALGDYRQKMYGRYEEILAQAIASELDQKIPSAHVQAYARFAIGVQWLVVNAESPKDMLEASFDLLDNGWNMIVEKL